MKPYFYYVVIYNGNVYKDTIIESKEFVGCTFIEKDKFQVNGRPDCEGLVLRVNANKQLLEENLRMNPIDVPKIIKLRFSPFPSTKMLAIVEDNKDSKVESPKQTGLKCQPSLTETTDRVNKNASSPRLKPRSTHKLETMRKRKLEVVTHEKLSSADKNTKNPEKNKVDEDKKKETEVQNIANDSDDMSIHKKYKVYKRKSPHSEGNVDNKMREQEAHQENVPITSESSDGATTNEFTLQSRNRDTEKTINPDFKSQIEPSANEDKLKHKIAPETNNNLDKKMEEQLQTVPQVDSDECIELEDEMFLGEKIRVRLCVQEYDKLFVNYEKLKKRYRQLNRSNMLLYKYINNLCMSTSKILKHNDMPSFPRYTPGASAGLRRRVQFLSTIPTIDSDDSISDCSSDNINFID